MTEPSETDKGREPCIGCVHTMLHFPMIKGGWRTRSIAQMRITICKDNVYSLFAWTGPREWKHRCISSLSLQPSLSKNFRIDWIPIEYPSRLETTKTAEQKTVGWNSIQPFLSWEKEGSAIKQDSISLNRIKYIIRLCHRKWLMLFSLKFQGNSQ